MTPTQRRILIAAVSVAVAGLLIWQISAWQRPDRVFYRNTTAARAAEARETIYRLTGDPVTIGRAGDIRTTSGVVSGVVATLEPMEGEDGGLSWRVTVSSAATESVLFNGVRTQEATLADGDVVLIEPYEVRFETGPVGLAALDDWWESATLTRQFLSREIAQEAFPIIFAAFPVAVLIVLVSFAIAMPLGLGLAFMKMAKTRWARLPATLYVDVIRGTPLFLQILLVFFGLPLMPFYRTITEAVPAFNQAGLFGITNSLYVRAFLVLSLSSAAYMCEIFRAGIQSIHKGQTEAARSLGMTTPQAMAFVIIPQTVRRILPTMMSEFILLFKDTALLAAVGLAEMALKAKEISASKFNTTPYVVAAALYLVVTVPLGRFVQQLENKLAESEGGGHATFHKSAEQNLATTAAIKAGEISAIEGGAKG